MFDPAEFDRDSIVAGIARNVKTIETPQPDGSSETNKMWCYKHGDTYCKVSKVSDRGWSVKRYTATESQPRFEEHVASKQSAQSAHRIAIETLL